MKARLFADQCNPLEIVHALRQQGHEVLLLRERLPIRSVDHLVIAKAQELQALLLSLKGDFADIVTYQRLDLTVQAAKAKGGSASG